MAFDLEDVIITISNVKPIKKGTEEDNPLGVSFEVDLTGNASDILPYFAPELTHTLFDDEGELRFLNGMRKIPWNITMFNMELALPETKLSMVGDFTKFVIYPFTYEQAKDVFYRKQVRVAFKVKIKHVELGNVIALLSELMGSEVSANLKESQLILEEIKEQEKAREKPGDGAKPTLKMAAVK